MASRFFVTGAQLGMIKGIAAVVEDKEVSKKINEIIDNIIEHQCIGDSRNPIEMDVDYIINMFANQ